MVKAGFNSVFAFLADMENLFSRIYLRLRRLSFDPYVSTILTYLYMRSSGAAAIYGRLAGLYRDIGGIDPRHLEVYEMLLEAHAAVESGGIGFWETIRLLRYAEETSSPIQYFPTALSSRSPASSGLILSLGKTLSIDKRERALLLRRLIEYHGIRGRGGVAEKIKSIIRGAEKAGATE